MAREIYVTGTDPEVDNIYINLSIGGTLYCEYLEAAREDEEGALEEARSIWQTLDEYTKAAAELGWQTSANEQYEWILWRNNEQE